jgi:uncharacterized protein YuzE
MMLANPEVRYDDEADVLYVRLSEEDVAETIALSDLHLLDRDASGGVVGIEFISPGDGIDLSGAPLRATIEKAIRDSGLSIAIFA